MVPVQEHCSDPEPIVAQSCVVALDMLAHEHLARSSMQMREALLEAG